MAIIKGQTNAKSSGGNSGNDLSPYLIYGISPTFDDDENVYVYDLDDEDIFIQNINGEEATISDFVIGQLIYEIDEYGKYLKGIWEFDRIIDGTNKIAVFSYGEIPSTPIIEIDSTQAKNTPNEYSLTLEQYREFIVNDIVKVVFPNDNTQYVYVKAQFEDETAMTFSRGEWDSVNSQYIVEKLTLTGTLPSTFDLVHTTEALSSGGGGSTLYKHNIRYEIGGQSAYHIKATLIIENDNPNQMTWDDIKDWLVDNGFTASMINYSVVYNAWYGDINGCGKDSNNGYFMIPTGLTAYSSDGGSTYTAIQMQLCYSNNFNTPINTNFFNTASGATIKDTVIAL